MNMSSISFKKYIFMVLIAMSSGLLYSALPPQRNILRAAIKEDLRKSLVTLAQLVTLPDHAISDALDTHDVEKLVEFQEFTNNFRTQIDHFKKQVEAQLAKPKPVVPIKPPAIPNPVSRSAAVATAQGPTPIERKSINEAVQRKKTETLMPSVTLAQAVKDNQTLVTADDSYGSLGPDTANLIAKNPKYKVMMEIGTQVKTLLDLTAHEKKLRGYISMGKRVTHAQDALLITLNTCSDNQLNQFILYVKALIEGKNVESFYRRFDEETMIPSWVLRATEKMDLEKQLRPLHALLDTVVKLVVKSK